MGQQARDTRSIYLTHTNNRAHDSSQSRCEPLYNLCSTGLGSVGITLSRETRSIYLTHTKHRGHDTSQRRPPVAAIAFFRFAMYSGLPSPVSIRIRRSPVPTRYVLVPVVPVSRPTSSVYTTFPIFYNTCMQKQNCNLQLPQNNGKWGWKVPTRYVLVPARPRNGTVTVTVGVGGTATVTVRVRGRGTVRVRVRVTVRCRVRITVDQIRVGACATPRPSTARRHRARVPQRHCLQLLVMRSGSMARTCH